MTRLSKDIRDRLKWGDPSPDVSALDASPGISSTTFKASVGRVGRGGLCLYVPKVAAKNADLKQGEKIEVTISRVMEESEA